MKRTLLICLQIIAGVVLWFWVVVFCRGWLPLYSSYGTDASRIAAKGIAILATLFILAQCTAYGLRRLISK
jgi:hypothetical protein